MAPAMPQTLTVAPMATLGQGPKLGFWVGTHWRPKHGLEGPRPEVLPMAKGQVVHSVPLMLEDIAQRWCGYGPQVAAHVPDRGVGVRKHQTSARTK